MSTFDYRSPHLPPLQPRTAEEMIAADMDHALRSAIENADPGDSLNGHGTTISGGEPCANQQSSEEEGNRRGLAPTPGQSVVITLEQARGMATCPACPAVKERFLPFCKACFLALPLAQRIPLRDKHREEEAFASSLAFLRLHTERRTKFVGDSQHSWRYHSAADLEAAGYQLKDYAQCPSPRCGARIAWYRTPNQALMAINFPEYTPHAATCTDPKYGERRAEFKKQQRAQKRAATMRARRRR